MKAVKHTANLTMKRLVEQISRQELGLDERLSRYLTDGVIERDGFILLGAEKDSAGAYDPRAHFDETGYECFVNHIHIDPKEGDDTSQLRLGLAFVERLVEILQSSGYHEPFRLILSCGLDDRICTVRFHRVREGQSWLASNLEEYNHEGILVIDC